MKAILVIDMPKSCDECEVKCDGYTAKQYAEKGITRPSWCPLKHLEENYISIDWLRQTIPFQNEEDRYILLSMLEAWRKNNESILSNRCK